MPVTLDREAILEAYQDVRNDKSDTIWSVKNVIMIYVYSNNICMFKNFK